MSVKAQKKKGLEKLSTRSKYAAIGGKDTKRELYRHSAYIIMH